MNKGLFIALEGIDGSGKSTQAKLLTARLQQAGHKVHATYEPTNGHVGRLLRSILKGEQKADNRVIAGLFLADRLDHLLNEQDGIVKLINDGYTVITDRYYFSSYAYHGTHMDMDWVIDANRMCASTLRPDINIFIDVEPETAMRRIIDSRAQVELYETHDNLLKVRAKYMEAFHKLESVEKIMKVKGDRPAAAIAADIWEIVNNLRFRNFAPVEKI